MIRVADKWWMRNKSKIQILQNFGKTEGFYNAELFSIENCSSSKEYYKIQNPRKRKYLCSI